MRREAFDSATGHPPAVAGRRSPGWGAFLGRRAAGGGMHHCPFGLMIFCGGGERSGQNGWPPRRLRAVKAGGLVPLWLWVRRPARGTRLKRRPKLEASPVAPEKTFAVGGHARPPGPLLPPRM